MDFRNLHNSVTTGATKIKDLWLFCIFITNCFTLKLFLMINFYHDLECCRNFPMMTLVLDSISRRHLVRQNWKNVLKKSFPPKWRTFSSNEQYNLNNGWYLPRNYWIFPTQNPSSISSVLFSYSFVLWMSSSGITYFMKNVFTWTGDLIYK